MRSRAALVPVVAAFGIVAGGCGGSSSHLSKAAYEAKLQAAGSQMEKALESADAPLLAKLKPPTRVVAVQNQASNLGQGSFITGTDSGLQGRRMAGLIASAFDRAAGELAALNPPENAKTDNERVVAGLRFFARIFRAGQKLGGTQDAALMHSIVYSPILLAFLAAQTDLQHKGYNLGALSAISGSQSSTKLLPWPQCIRTRLRGMRSRTGAVAPTLHPDRVRRRKLLPH